MPKKPHRIAQEVKADILRRIKEDGITVQQAAADHGIHETTIYAWLTKRAEGAPTLGELVAEVHRLVYAYNHTRIHSALKMPPAVFAEKSAHRMVGVRAVEKVS